MKKEYLNPKALSKPGAYTHVVSVAAPAKLVYVSGQVSFAADGSIVAKGAENVAAYREVRARFLTAGQLPASTLVGVTRLVQADLLLEVEVVAALGGDKAPAKAKKRS